MKKTRLGIVGVIIAVISGICGALLDPDGTEIEEVNSVFYNGDYNELSIILKTFEKGAVVAIKVVNDVEIPHSDRMRLMGDIGFTGLPGDVLVLIKDDGWYEIGRRLVP